MNRILFGIVVCSAMISCGKKDAPVLPQVAKVTELSKADWLLGNWESNSEQGSLLETWTRANDSVYKGSTYFVTGKDTMFTESIELVERNGKLVYIALVSSQNEGQPVSFPATTTSSQKLIFENVGHDFPKKISYTKVSADSLVAEISGIEKGKPKSEKFSMIKAR